MPQPETILDNRRRKQKHEVLVHWQGFSPAEATWENFEELQLTVPDVVRI